MGIPEIEKMTTSERLTTMEQLWDSICHEKEAPDSPTWHKPILENRKAQMSASDAKFYTLEQLRERFR